MALEDCEEALENSAENVKALFRKGQALHGKRDYDKAMEVLSTAQKLAPNDKAINSELVAVRGEIQTYKAKERKAFSKMFA